MDEVTAGSVSSDHREAIKERLRQIRDLLRLSRYRPTPAGHLSIEDSGVGGSRAREPQEPAATGGKSGGNGGTAGSVYSVFLDPDGVSGEEVASDPHPITKWVSIEDGTRQAGQMEDRAAEFLADQNLLLINADFRVFGDMVDRWCAQYGDGAVRPAVVEVVQEWFEQTLVEAVLGVQALRDDREWHLDDMNHALSKEALTAAVICTA